MIERYVIRRKLDNMYYRSSRAKHLFDNWVQDIQFATVFYSNAYNNYFRYSDKELYEKVYVKLNEKGNAEKENDLQYEMDCLRESKIELEKNFEKLLHELRDRDIVNWWLNGEGYHWEFNEDVRRKYGKEK